MTRRPLGRTGLHVSEVGFGCWQLGGVGWGKSRGDAMVRAVQRALELGITVFDTAPVYGLGRSEELLAKALGARSSEATIISKGGLSWDARGRVAHDNSPEGLARQLEGSLRRLRRETIDVYLLHWPDPAVPLEASIQAIHEFIQAGRVRAWGLSNFPADEVRTVAVGRPEPAMERAGPVLEYPRNVGASYAPEYRDAAAAGESLLPDALRNEWGFLAFDVLQRGLLAGKCGDGARPGKRDVRSRDDRFTGAALTEGIERASRLRNLALRAGASATALAVRAVLNVRGVTCCLVGIKTPRQVEECAAAASLRIEPETEAGLLEITSPRSPADRP